MVLTKNIKIKISSNNIKKINIENIKVGQEIEIPIELLNEGSHTRIQVKCDICGKEKYIEYRQYLKSLKNGNFYCCSPKCAISKNKQTCLNRYGDENYNNMEKNRKSCLEKYGVKYSLQDKSVRKKGEKTCLKKYGVDSSNKSEIVKNNKKISYLKKYGVENPSQSEIIKETKKQTTLINYGVENPMYNDQIKEKLKKTCIKKYGGIGLSSIIIKEKSKNTNLKKYGCENVFQNEEIKEKIKQDNIKKYGVEFYTQSLKCKKIYINSYIKKYGVLPDDRNLQIKLYRNEITCLTKKNKKELLENWDGYDFYDGEYIKGNFNLHPMHKSYPTIDHKISVYYGFNNKILPEEIAKIENLCWTKRSLNSKKGENCYEGEEKN